LPDGMVGVSLKDVTRRRHAELVQDAERRALGLLAAGASTTAILDVMIAAIEACSTDSMASILVLDAAGERVRHKSAPRLPGDYTAAIAGLPIGPSAGSCGPAAYRGEPVYVADIATDPLWADYRELASRFSLRSCWSSPILASTRRV